MKRSYSKLRIFIVSIWLIIISVVVSGCRPYKGYMGEYPELLTVAINNLLGTKGYFQQGEVIDDSQIKIIEEDNNGRVLFAYSEFSEVSTLNLLIMQKKDDNYAYYYPDYCFISTGVPHLDYSYWGSVFEDNLENSFSEEDIEKLKGLNDWNEELNETKWVKSEIVRKKIEPKIDKKLFEDFYDYKMWNYEDYTLFRFSIYLTSDDYGRMIFLAVGITKDDKPSNGRSLWEYFVFITNSEGSFYWDTSAMSLTDFYNYQEKLKELKDLNNWNVSPK